MNHPEIMHQFGISGEILRTDRSEFKVIILDCSPSSAGPELMKELANGWEPVMSYADDRVIMKRIVTTYKRKKGERIES